MIKLELNKLIRMNFQSRRAKSRIGSETEELWKEVDKQTGGEASPSTSSDETRPVIQPVSQALVPDEPGSH